MNRRLLETPKIGFVDSSVSDFAARSSLEEDFELLLSFDANVERVEVRPLSITFVNSIGRIENYLPYAFVRYRRDIRPARHLRHVLCDVVPRNRFHGCGVASKQRLRAARLYASERGWEFRVLTEREIRTPFLENIRLLGRYRDVPIREEDEYAVLSQLHRVGNTSPAELLAMLGNDSPVAANRWNRAIWKLIANLEIATNLDAPVSATSRIWCRW